jgi:hypothetical protein
MLLKMLKGSMGGTRPPPTGLFVHGHRRWEIAMTDPRDFDRRMEMERQMEMERRMSAPAVWGWIAGAVFIIVILALVFAGGESTRTAPPAVAVPPAQPPSTTGQSQ